MSNRSPAKPSVVIDFRCDACGEKLNAVIVAKAGTQTRIAKAYHEECWVKQQFKSARGVH